MIWGNGATKAGTRTSLFTISSAIWSKAKVTLRTNQVKGEMTLRTDNLVDRNDDSIGSLSVAPFPVFKSLDVPSYGTP